MVGLRVFEIPKPVAEPGENTTSVNYQNDTKDTVIVPAQQEGFERVFLGENCWHAIRIGGGKLDKIRYIAAYQTAPVSAITHIAPVNKIEPFGDGVKYKLIFSEPARQIKSIPFDDAPKASMMSPRYASMAKFKEATKLSDLFQL